MGMIQLVAFVQREFHIHVDPKEVVPANFDTLENLERFIRAKTEKRT